VVTSFFQRVFFGLAFFPFPFSSALADSFFPFSCRCLFFSVRLHVFPLFPHEPIALFYPSVPPPFFLGSCPLFLFKAGFFIIFGLLFSRSANTVEISSFFPFLSIGGLSDSLFFFPFPSLLFFPAGQIKFVLFFFLYRIV